MQSWLLLVPLKPLVRGSQFTQKMGLSRMGVGDSTPPCSPPSSALMGVGWRLDLEFIF